MTFEPWLNTLGQKLRKCWRSP